MAKELALKSSFDDELASERKKRDCDEFEGRSEMVFSVEMLFRILKGSLSVGRYDIKLPSAPYPSKASQG
jgi:hypothetical protein